MNDLFQPKEILEENIESLLEEPKEETFEGETADIDTDSKYFIMANPNRFQLTYLMQAGLKPQFAKFKLSKTTHTLEGFKSWHKEYDLTYVLRYNSNGDVEQTKLILAEDENYRPKYFRKMQLKNTLKRLSSSVYGEWSLKQRILEKGHKEIRWGHVLPEGSYLSEYNTSRENTDFYNACINLRYHGKQKCYYNIDQEGMFFLNEDFELFNVNQIQQYFVSSNIEHEQLTPAEAFSRDDLLLVHRHIFPM